jgi:hypothetical protein
VLVAALPWSAIVAGTGVVAIGLLGRAFARRGSARKAARVEYPE